MVEIIERKVKRKVAKDYQRNAKYFDYFFITYKNKDYMLALNGWKSGLIVKEYEVNIDGQRIKLVW